MSSILQDQTTTEGWLAGLFELYEQGLNGHKDHPHAQFRRRAFQRFQAGEFPDRKEEDWKYTPVSRMLEPRYQDSPSAELSLAEVTPFQFPNLDVIRIVFVNGKLREDLSQLHDLPAGARVWKVSEALEDQDLRQWMERQAAQTGGTAKNHFLPMNQAFAAHGLVFDMERNQRLETPLHLIYVSVPGEEAHFAHPQLFVRAQSGSELTFIESYHAKGQGVYFNNTANWIDVAANASVSHYKLQREAPQAFQVNNTLVRQDRDSRYSSYALDLGGRMVRNNLSTELIDSNTQSNFYGAYLANGSQHIDNQTFIDHAVPHCESNELYKGILKDKSRGVFNGKVLVRQDAQKTNAFQQNSSLVLSPYAVMDAKPQLEIFADDVRCSHGATIGHLDESSVFYLRSRGIPTEQARNLLQQAFLGEVLDHMKIDAIRESLRTLIADKLAETTA